MRQLYFDAKAPGDLAADWARDMARIPTPYRGHWICFEQDFDEPGSYAVREIGISGCASVADAQKAVDIILEGEAHV